MSSSRKQNHLINEKSPYLLQHAHNPVDWWPWCDEAFEKAKKEDKPILLSIGYYTCHWCHVMEKESYDDEEVGEAINKVFVPIKVDREERPDIDSTYMQICQKVSGNCGWPLNVFMTPDKKPFFITTYVPKESGYGMEGLLELVAKTDDLWKNSRKELVEDASAIIKSMEIEKAIKAKSFELDAVTLKMTYDHLLQTYDAKNGGFGYAPKFPSPHVLSYLLRYWKRYKDKNALSMVEQTITAMRLGGIFDQVGFGFHRYSTDEKWLVPHFEKMLYDQAMMAIACVETYQATGNDFYKKTAEEIFEFVLRDLTSKEGAFYTAVDADSDGEEGLFYIWTCEEFRNALGKDAELMEKVFNMTEDGNYSEPGMHAAKHRVPKNILYLKKTVPELAKELKMKESELSKTIDSSRRKLFATREKRTHPSVDDKILTDVNGLMISAFAKAAVVFSDKKYADVANGAANFILEKMTSPEGKLYHRYRKEAGIPAFLDDYAFFVNALIDVYEATFEVDYLRKAIALDQVAIEHFWDKKNGGFLFQSKDIEEMIVKKKDAHDGAIPSGNSLMMLNLLRLNRFTGDPKLEELALKLELAFSTQISRGPGSHAQFMSAVDFRIGPSYEIVIVEGDNREMVGKMLEKLSSTFIPNKIVMLKSKESTPIITKIADFTKFLDLMDNKTTACVCAHYACKRPTTDPEQMLKLLA